MDNTVRHVAATPPTQSQPQSNEVIRSEVTRRSFQNNLHKGHERIRQSQSLSLPEPKMLRVSIPWEHQIYSGSNYFSRIDYYFRYSELYSKAVENDPAYEDAACFAKKCKGCTNPTVIRAEVLALQNKYPTDTPKCIIEICREAIEATEEMEKKLRQAQQPLIEEADDYYVSAVEALGSAFSEISLKKQNPRVMFDESVSFLAYFNQEKDNFDSRAAQDQANKLQLNIEEFIARTWAEIYRKKVWAGDESEAEAALSHFSREAPEGGKSFLCSFEKEIAAAKALKKNLRDLKDGVPSAQLYEDIAERATKDFEEFKREKEANFAGWDNFLLNHNQVAAELSRAGLEIKR